jgi:hypothetical protein
MIGDYLVVGLVFVIIYTLGIKFGYDLAKK